MAGKLFRQVLLNGFSNTLASRVTLFSSYLFILVGFFLTWSVIDNDNDAYIKFQYFYFAYKSSRLMEMSHC